MRVKLESLTKPKCQTFPYGTKVKGWTGELEGSHKSRIKLVPREVKLALTRAKGEQDQAEASVGPRLVRKASSRLPHPDAPKVTTRSARATDPNSTNRGPSSDGSNGRTPFARKAWTEEDDDKLFQLRRELAGRPLSEIGARMKRTPSSVHARWAKHQKDGTLPEDLAVPLSPSVPPPSTGPAFLTPPTNLVPLPPVGFAHNHNPTTLPSLPHSSASPGYGWSAAETDLLVALCKHVPTPSWDQIAAKLPGRTADACARRHRRISNREIVPDPASPVVPDLPATLSGPALNGPMPTSSPTQGKTTNVGRAPGLGTRGVIGAGGAEGDRKRKRSLSTSVGIVPKSEWTKEENDLLLSLVECELPKSWSEVKEALPGRSEGACRGRYGRILKERDADAASKVDVVEVNASSATPPANKHSSSSEATRSSSIGPATESFWRAAGAELGTIRATKPSPAYLSSMIRLPSLPALPEPTGLGPVSGPCAQPAASPSYHAAFRVAVGVGKGAGPSEGKRSSFDGKENEGRRTSGTKRARWGEVGAEAAAGLDAGALGEASELAASALMGLNGW